jgi:hypothetical protein
MSRKLSPAERAQKERIERLRESLRKYREQRGEAPTRASSKASPRAEIPEFRSSTRSRWTKVNTVREGATKLKPSRRGMKRKAQPRARLAHGDTPDVYTSRSTVAAKAYARTPCKMTSLTDHKGRKRWGVFYGQRTKPQLFKTKARTRRRERTRQHGEEEAHQAQEGVRGEPQGPRRALRLHAERQALQLLREEDLGRQGGRRHEQGLPEERQARSVACAVLGSLTRRARFFPSSAPCGAMAGSTG